MMTPDQKLTNAMIDQATRPLRQRIDRLEKEVRKLKSDLNQTKNTVNRLKK